MISFLKLLTDYYLAHLQQKNAKIDWYLMHLCCKFARKMSQITHFCGVKFLAWKSGSVKFWTNIMSGAAQCSHTLKEWHHVGDTSSASQTCAWWAAGCFYKLWKKVLFLSVSDPMYVEFPFLFFTSSILIRTTIARAWMSSYKWLHLYFQFLQCKMHSSQSAFNLNQRNSEILTRLKKYK